MSYKAICRVLLLVLGLEVPGKAAKNQGRLPPVKGLGPLCKTVQGALSLEAPCLGFLNL